MAFSLLLVIIFILPSNQSTPSQVEQLVEAGGEAVPPLVLAPLLLPLALLLAARAAAARVGHQAAAAALLGSWRGNLKSKVVARDVVHAAVPGVVDVVGGVGEGRRIQVTLQSPQVFLEKWLFRDFLHLAVLRINCPCQSNM